MRRQIDESLGYGIWIICLYGILFLIIFSPVVFILTKGMEMAAMIELNPKHRKLLKDLSNYNKSMWQGYREAEHVPIDEHALETGLYEAEHLVNMIHICQAAGIADWRIKAVL